MESGNSGSFQSSTGDEEFDSHHSHGDGISALNNLAAALNNHQQQPPPSRPPPCNTVSSYMYDHHQPPPPPPLPPPQQPLENYQRSFMNSYVLDWSNNNIQRSETFTNPMLASVLASSHYHGSAALLQPPPPPPPPSVAENKRVSLSPPEPPPPKKPRKRSRASRGAATTVLTTDTTNFRAMVQEFTGIPEPPFPSHFQKSRLDIFGTVSSGITTTPPYLRRPFPQKISLPFSSSSSFLGSSSSSSNTNNMIINATTNALNYQFTPQSSSLFNLQNQFAPSFLGMKTHQESRDFVSNDDFSDQINTSMLRPTGFLGLITSDQRTSSNNNQAASVRWGNGTGSNQEDDQKHVITSAANSNFSFSSS